ncbi:MAG: hypothetical protein ABSD13_10005 [Candidatus Korobacteraceae bacterium]
MISAVSIALLCMALASPHNAVELEVRANDLLRQAVSNEKAGDKQDYYSWTDRLQKSRGSVTKLMVETPQGILARVVAFNDRALTADERRQDDERINRLLDPAKMREKAGKQKDDQQHIERILFALADAFQCEYGFAHDDRNLRLECSPNPSFSAPNYESQVLQGMKSVILIDREDKRIASIQGTLFRDVNFGWGFLGRLNRGGSIEITQSKVAAKHWGITRMQLTFEGRILIVKPLKVEETDTSWNYQSVPKMTVAEALEFLRNNSAKLSR